MTLVRAQFIPSPAFALALRLAAYEIGRKPKSDPQSLFHSRDPSQPPADRNLDNRLILAAN